MDMGALQTTVYDVMGLENYRVIDLLLEQDGRSRASLAAWLAEGKRRSDPLKRLEHALGRLVRESLIEERADSTVWLRDRVLAREISERWHLRRGLWHAAQTRPRLRPSALA